MIIDTKILSQEEIEEQLKEVPGWKFENERISKQFEFEDFLDSINFVNQLVPFVQNLDHHPDIHIFYNKIIFELQRFDVGGKVTNKDFMIAKEIERLYSLQNSN